MEYVAKAIPILSFQVEGQDQLREVYSCNLFVDSLYDSLK